MPALPTLSWPLRKDLPERGLALLPEPSSCSKAIGCAKSQSEHRNGGGRVGGGGRERLAKEKVDEQPSNPTSSKCMELTDFNYIAF